MLQTHSDIEDTNFEPLRLFLFVHNIFAKFDRLADMLDAVLNSRYLGLVEGN